MRRIIGTIGATLAIVAAIGAGIYMPKVDDATVTEPQLAAGRPNIGLGNQGGDKDDVSGYATFAQQNWVYGMSPYIEGRKAELIPSQLETV
jgi:hypothetical protein